MSSFQRHESRLSYMLSILLSVLKQCCFFHRHKSEQPLFFIENDADIPASKNIKGMNHGDINTTIEAIGLTLWKNI